MAPSSHSSLMALLLPYLSPGESVWRGNEKKLKPTYPKKNIPWWIETGRIDSTNGRVTPIGQDSTREPWDCALVKPLFPLFVTRYRIHYDKVYGRIWRPTNLIKKNAIKKQLTFKRLYAPVLGESILKLTLCKDKLVLACVTQKKEDSSKRTIYKSS